MHSPIVWQITWHSEADTEAFANTFVARTDLSNATLELQGDLGAGKTTLTRYLLQALGISQIRS